MSDTPRTDVVMNEHVSLYPSEGEVQLSSLARHLERELYDAHLEKNIQQQRAEKAERELAEARNALLWYAYASNDQDEPVEVRAAYNAAERARGNADEGAAREKAERELALARPVIEAAHYAAGVFDVLPLEQQGAHVKGLVRAIRAYDAARENGESQ
jgi:hypothetical protein